MDDMKKLIIKLIRKYDTNNIFEIAEYLNCIVVLAPLIDSKGFYQYFKRNNIIYINNALANQEQELVCAHELGHALLHGKINSMLLNAYTLAVTNRYENEANLFAAYFVLSKYSTKELSELTIEQLSLMTGINVFTLNQINLRKNL